SLSTGSSTVVNLPSATLSGNSSHSLTVIITSPNGAVDINPYNGYKVSTTPFFVFPSVGTATPVVEGFQGSTFPPANWTLNNPDNSAYKWIRYSAVGGFGNTSACARMNFFGSTNGQFDELFLPAADLQLALSGSFLSFSVAYAQKTTQNDRLQIQVSTNCGQSWATAYDKSGSALSTHAPFSASAWVPAPVDWRTDSVYLDNYIGNSNVLIKFKAISNAGNNLYVDDVNFQFVTGIDGLSSSSAFDVYPNPTNGLLNVNLNLDGSSNVLIRVYNSIGERVMSRELKNAVSGPYSLNLSELSAGNYVVQLVNGKNNSVRKITVNK
ncbi:MAG: T9SS type A sorting domain-containing protein, partial [Bacteroidia bacterium]|nr:T9SS type A sorting domain-containing protein [Bacteroidia bacterium]